MTETISSTRAGSCQAINYLKLGRWCGRTSPGNNGFKGANYEIYYDEKSNVD
jgi:hypothetical protein